MDISYAMKGSKRDNFRECILMFCMVFFFLPQYIFAAQVTEPSSKSSHHKKELMAQVAIREDTIMGKVSDAGTGEALPGVNILVVGTTAGTTTDGKGEYELTVPSLQDTLRFSYIGYKTRKVAIKGRTKINIKLRAATTGLDEMVVIGFGEQSKRKIVGSVSSVKMESMEKVHASTFDQKLGGKISGVNVTTSSGRLGSAVKINIRGTSSVNASSQPLYVIDGVPLVADQLGRGGGVGGVNGTFNPFINLGSDNIKSIEVLKDASAAAVYGTRGANGVILITTKNGNAGQPQLNINVSGGISHATKKLDLLNSSEYINTYNYKNNTNYDPSDFSNNDWQDAISRTGSFKKYNVSFSGGANNDTYFLSGNYENNKGSVIGNTLKKFNAYIKANHEFNDRLKIGLTLNPSVTNYNALRGFGQVGSSYGFAILEPPVVPVFKPDGSPNDGRDPSVPENALFSPFPGTPYTNVKYIGIENITMQNLMNASLSYDILSNLTLNSKFGYQFLNNKVNNRGQNNTVIGYPNGTIASTTHSFRNANWNNTLTYKKDVGDNSLQVTLGVTIEKNNIENSSVTKRNVPINSLNDLNSASEITGGSGSNTSYAFQNNIARVSYSYKDKYLLTLTGSYNGTSRFAKKERYGFFPAASAGWILSDEEFLKDFNALSFLKLRASYGVVGNANIGNFEYLPLLGANVSYFDEPGLSFAQLANLNLTWETVNEYDLGLDFGFFDGRINGTIGYYNKITTNLLLRSRVSDLNGFTEILKNGGKMLNQGVEFNFDADIVLTSDFQWNISGNISTLRNEVKELPGGQIISSPNIVREGESIAAFYMPVYVGVDPQNGDALYADGKGGTTSNYSMAPRKIVGSPQPTLYGGFGTNLSYMGLDFSMAFSYTYGNKLYWGGAEYLIGGSSIYNQAKSAYDYWTPQNKNASNPEPRLSPNGSNTSTRFLEDGTYLRLKSIELGYTFNINSIGAKNIRLYLSATNLATFTSFSGFDPEGTTTTTSNIRQGVVDGNDPQNYTINGGIQIKM